MVEAMATDDAPDQDVSPDGGKRSHTQSTIEFPYGDLDDAVGIVQAISANAGSGCTTAQLAAYLNSKSVDGGAFRLKIATARIFGLIETDRGSITLTTLGHQILDPSQRSAATAAAFLTVPLYREIFKKYEGYALPKDIGLENDFVTLGVAPKQKAKARQAFQRSAESAGFFAHGKDRLVTPAALPPTRPIEDGVKPDETSSERESHSRSGSGSGSGTPSLPTLIQGLIEKLPPEGHEWSEAEQDQWLSVAKAVFGLVYPTTRLALPPGRAPEHELRGGDASRLEELAVGGSK